MITNENRTWIVSCDICHKHMATLPQTTIQLSDEPDKDKVLDAVDINHYAVCDEHEFDEQTGEWK